MRTESRKGRAIQVAPVLKSAWLRYDQGLCSFHLISASQTSPFSFAISASANARWLCSKIGREKRRGRQRFNQTSSAAVEEMEVVERIERAAAREDSGGSVPGDEVRISDT